MAFEYTFLPSFAKTDHVLFAYAQPFTKTDIDRSIDMFEAEMKEHNSDIYFHREVLIDSLEGNPMHYLTVTWRNMVQDSNGEMESKDDNAHACTGQIPD